MVSFLSVLCMVAGPLPLHVTGTQLLDSDNKPVHLHGVNIPSLEWTATGEHVMDSVHEALDVWGANIIRMPLSQDRWFGKAPDSKDRGESYQALVAQAVDAIHAHGAHVLLDLHWSDGGVWGQKIGQHTLPDVHSTEFWQSCATRFANDPAVLFDLYNEPIKAEWSTWRNGGPVSETFQGKPLSYQAVGLQQLLDTIRKTGAHNVIVAGGLGYSSQLDFPGSALLSDPSGNGVVYASHFYPGWENVQGWQARIEKAATHLPLLVGEFGDDIPSAPMDTPAHRIGQILQVLKKNDFNWIAWCMHPAAGPCLIKDWSYTPTPEFGSLVMLALKGEPVPIAARKTTAPTRVAYDGKMEEPFQSWSTAKVDVASKEVIHTSPASIKVTLGAGQQFQLGTVPFDGLAYRAVRFWINGGSTGGQKLVMLVNIMDKSGPAVKFNTVDKDWTQVTIPFSTLGIAGQEDVKSFIIKSADGGASEPFYLDGFEVVGK